ncbi:family 43 glycosylhydrolase, partial [Streptomyces sioyaensis]|uniref:family 43 glycosylhydrolase n=1 Tax=Streptomyces sioyaensis TaxID=67364 RepID=UPI003D74D57E
MIYNQSTHKYVTWVLYNADPTVGARGDRSYLIFTADSPAGPFTKVASAKPSTLIGDQTLFEDSDGTGYLAWTDQAAGGRMHVTRLSSDYLSVATGAQASDTWIGNTVFREAPQMFKRASTYYLTMSKGCPYCTTSPTYVYTASSPSGPWTAKADISSNSCGGQPTNVLAMGSTYLYQSDLFDTDDANN